MQLPINETNVNLFAYTNGRFLRETPKALVLSFHGLNNTSMITDHADFPLTCAEKGVLFAAPYDNPWSWMNDVAVRTVDAIVDALLKKYALDDLPVVSTGGSMGGLSALIYARYSHHAIKACAAKYPVCDLPYHFTERPDLPRTIVSALAHYDMPLEQAMESISPLHQVNQMPDIPYLIIHGDMDLSVNQKMHSERFVELMQQAGKQIRYVPVLGAGHGKLPADAIAVFEQFVLDACGVTA